MTLAGEACLARNADTLTEPVIIRLKEYWIILLPAAYSC
jgi:hypothetical protein